MPNNRTTAAWRQKRGGGSDASEVGQPPRAAPVVQAVGSDRQVVGSVRALGRPVRGAFGVRPASTVFAWATPSLHPSETSVGRADLRLGGHKYTQGKCGRWRRGVAVCRGERGKVRTRRNRSELKPSTTPCGINSRFRPNANGRLTIPSVSRVALSTPAETESKKLIVTVERLGFQLAADASRVMSIAERRLTAACQRMPSITVNTR